MDMTEEKALKLTIDVWHYLATHPELTKKTDLPPNLWNKLMGLTSTCPLCSFYQRYSWGENCKRCPLVNILGFSDDFRGDCMLKGGFYIAWKASSFDNFRVRRDFAEAIVEKCMQRLKQLGVKNYKIKVIKDGFKSTS